MRIDDAGSWQHLRGALSRSARTLEELRREIATGERLRHPSRDPAGYSRALGLRVEVRRLRREADRMERAARRLDRYDALIGELGEDLRRARTIVLRASQDATADPEPLVRELEGVIEAALARANTREEGGYLMAGSRAEIRPFEAERSAGRVTGVVYRGDHRFPGPLPGLSLSGGAVAGELFEALVEVRDALRSGSTDSSALLGRLEGAEERLLERRMEAAEGSRYLDQLAQAARGRVLRLEEELEGLVGVDLAEGATRLFQAETLHAALLQVAARRSRLSLVEFLR